MALKVIRKIVHVLTELTGNHYGNPMPIEQNEATLAEIILLTKFRKSLKYFDNHKACYKDTPIFDKFCQIVTCGSRCTAVRVLV